MKTSDFANRQAVRRREFLMCCGIAAQLSGKARAQTQNKFDRVCVLSWSFRNLFAKTRDRGIPAPAKDFDIFDFPEMVADRCHIHNVEVQSMYFASSEPPYLLKFGERLKRAKSRLIDIPLEFDNEPGVTPTISSPDPKVRDRAIDLSMQWIDGAAALGSRAVMPNQGIVNSSEPSLTIEALKKLKVHAASRNVNVILENRGNSAGKPDVLARIIKASGVYANPDFGNFPNKDTCEAGCVSCSRWPTGSATSNTTQRSSIWPRACRSRKMRSLKVCIPLRLRKTTAVILTAPSNKSWMS